MTAPMRGQFDRLPARPDHEAARRTAQRLVDEFPKLIQPDLAATNLARAYLQLVGTREPLTKRQADVYRYLLAYIREYKYAPSFDEIMEKFGFSSYGSVHEHLTNLERKGYIAREFNAARSIKCLVDLDEVGEPAIIREGGE